MFHVEAITALLETNIATGYVNCLAWEWLSHREPDLIGHYHSLFCSLAC